MNATSEPDVIVSPRPAQASRNPLELPAINPLSPVPKRFNRNASAAPMTVRSLSFTPVWFLYFGLSWDTCQKSAVFQRQG